MGSGRGKARRAQRTRPEISHVAMDTDIWDKFVAEHGLTSVKVTDYYGLSAPDISDELLCEEYEKKFVKNLFYDLVEMGAVQLPDSVGVEDFNFIIKRYSSTKYLCIEYSGNSEPIYDTHLGDSRDWMRDDMISMGGIPHSVAGAAYRLGFRENF